MEQRTDETDADRAERRAKEQSEAIAARKKDIIAWLNKHWHGSKTCPICQSNQWGPSGTLVELRPYSGGALTLGGPIFAVVPITCTVCGHTLLFNAKVAGLAEEE